MANLPVEPKHACAKYSYVFLFFDFADLININEDCKVITPQNSNTNKPSTNPHCAIQNGMACQKGFLVENLLQTSSV